MELIIGPFVTEDTALRGGCQDRQLSRIERRREAEYLIIEKDE